MTDILDLADGTDLADCPSTGAHDTKWAADKHGCRCLAARDDVYTVSRRYYRNKRARHGLPLYYTRPIVDIVDPIAVQRAVAGDPPLMSTSERTAAVTALTAQGWSGNQIAAHLRMSRRTVERHRARAAQRTAQPVTPVAPPARSPEPAHSHHLEGASA